MEFEFLHANTLTGTVIYVLGVLAAVYLNLRLNGPKE